MVEDDEVMTSLPCDKGELDDEMSISDTWEGPLVNGGCDGKVFGSLSGVEVILFGYMSFGCDIGIISDV